MEVRRAKVRRMKVNGRSPWMEIGTATSEVTTPQLARELCGDGDGNVELQRCKLALLHHCKLATLQHCKLAMLQHCKFTSL